MFNRRSQTRVPVDLFFNKYLDGYPYLCRGLNLSRTGLLAMTFSEPEQKMESFSIELRLPGEKSSLWLWARGVWRQSDCQAMQFVTPDRESRRRLHRFMEGVTS